MSTTGELAVPGALVGAATGLRSSSGVVAVLTGMPSEHLPGPLQGLRVRVATVLLGAGELVGDKLPRTPDRTSPAALIPRVVLGAAAAGQLARAAAAPAPPVAAVGLGASLAAAYGGLWWRRWMSSRVHPLVAAVLEDVTSAVLAAAAVRLTRRAIDARPGPITEQVAPLRSID